MAVKLEFLTQDSEEIALATRYWAMDDEGAYLERVANMVPFRDIQQSGQIAKRVREFCIAFDENQQCYLCGNLVEINGRTEAKKSSQISSIPCASCASAQRIRRAEQQAQEEQKVSKMLVDLAKRNASIELNYADLPDDVVLLLFAINALVAPRLAEGSFGVGDCEDLAPQNGYELVMRLVNEHYLLQDYSVARPGTYYLKDDELWRKVFQIELFLPPDVVHGRGADALNFLQERVFSDAEALTNLWLDYAVGDVLHYLLDQCSTYNHDLDQDAVDKVKAMVRHALHTYSVSQLWSVMWKVVRDAASLANREYYNRPKATATIPNKIRKLLEAADQQGGVLKPWDRPQSHIAGSLGMVFSNLFGINEYSQGSAVLAGFRRLRSSNSPGSNEELRFLAESFMRGALDGSDPWEALQLFANNVRAGLTTEEAILEFVSQQGDVPV
jgi:hypothetical protein